jgi:hypothetical protein
MAKRIEDLSPLQLDALHDCVKRGSTRTNDGGLVDDLLSALCSNTEIGISNGWLVRWDMNPGFRQDGYTSIYTPTELGREACQRLASEPPD